MPIRLVFGRQSDGGLQQTEKRNKTHVLERADFEEESLNVKGAKFKDSSIFYNHSSEINLADVIRWLKKSRDIQWNYKDLIKQKGKLSRLKP